MSAELFERSAAVFRGVLVEVRPDQLGGPTPCGDLNVAQLVEKAIGHTHWVRQAIQGESGPLVYAAIDPGKYLVEFDACTAAMVSELESVGAATRTVKLAAGLQFTGAETAILADRNTFQYAWDLAMGTGQSTELAPGLARELLAISKTRLVPPRGPTGFFGPVFEPGEGATDADVLAGFLGRVF